MMISMAAIALARAKIAVEPIRWKGRNNFANVAIVAAAAVTAARRRFSTSIDMFRDLFQRMEGGNSGARVELGTMA